MRLDVDLMKRVDRLATREDRSRASVVEMLLREALGRREPPAVAAASGSIFG